MKPNRGCKQVHYLLLTITLSILLTACGGGEGGNSTTNNNPPAATVSQGVLIDAAVEGVRFETPTQSGLRKDTGQCGVLAASQCATGGPSDRYECDTLATPIP